MTVKQRQGPRQGSAAYNALEHLAHLGGSASPSQLTGAVLSHFRSARRFQELVMEPLLHFKLVKHVDGDEIRITASGLAFIRPANEPTEKYPPVAGPVEPRPFKPLSPKYFAGNGMRRVGADEFRKHPSLMGGMRVPYWGAGK